MNYRDEGRIQQLDRFGDLVTASVSGSKLYDVTVEFGGRSIDTQCTCPYEGSGDCKHVVAVLLDIAADPPQDESERVEAVVEDVSAEEYREEIAQLFEQHADPVVFEAIDFSRLFDIAEQYRDRERYLAAATVYRAVFEEIDEKYNWIDDAYDHCANAIQTAIDGYADCVLATDPTPEEFDTYAGVLEKRATTEPRINDEQFWRALDNLEERYKQ